MIVTVNLLHVIAVSSVAMILCGLVGYYFGAKDGYLRGWMNADALIGLEGNRSQPHD